MLYKQAPLHNLSPSKQPKLTLRAIPESSTMTYQQRRVEYEVREYNNAASGFTYGTNNAPSGFAYGANTAASGFSSGDAAYGGASYGSSGYSSGGGGGGYSSGGGGYSSDSGFGATGNDSGFYGGSAAAGGFNMSSGGGQAQVYKNEMQAMPVKTSMCVPEMFQGRGGGTGGDPFYALVPSSFPPGTDPKFIDCFNRIDKDRSGLICDQELQSALSNFDQRFSLRTVHLLMYMFTGSNSKVVGPKEFVPLVRSLQTWKATFQKYDCNRNGRLDERELRDALMSMGFMVSPLVLKLLVSKYDKSGYKCAIEYDYFIECCVIVKGLTEKFRAKEDTHACGTATFTCDEFLLTVLPFIVA